MILMKLKNALSGWDDDLDGGNGDNRKTSFIFPSINARHGQLDNRKKVRTGIYPVYYRELDGIDLDILANGIRIFERIIIISAAETKDRDFSALKNRL